MLPHFSSLRPKTKGEALTYLSDLDRAKLLAGGTDLLVRMKRGESHDYLIDITAIEELSGAVLNGGRIRVGAGTTHRSLSLSPLVLESARSLAQAASWIGSPQIRTMGTIGGNLVNASPAADSIPPLLVHDALLTLESMDGERTERVEDFIIAPYTTTTTGREMLTALSLEPLPAYEEGYRRVAKRAAWAISRLGIAWSILEQEGTFADVRLAIGSCTPLPFRARKVERFLTGRKREIAVTREAVKICLDEIRRISGERPSFTYKLPVVRDLLQAILGGR
jgi:CO/xanthine dehydrogenase FAD-binding subunit